MRNRAGLPCRCSASLAVSLAKSCVRSVLAVGRGGPSGISSNPNGRKSNSGRTGLRIGFLLARRGDLGSRSCELVFPNQFLFYIQKQFIKDFSDGGSNFFLSLQPATQGPPLYLRNLLAFSP